MSGAARADGLVFEVWEMDEAERDEARPTSHVLTGGRFDSLQRLVKETGAGELKEAIGRIVNQFAEVFRPTEGGPKSCQLEFGIKVTGEGSVIVSKLAVQSQLVVRVVWER